VFDPERDEEPAASAFYLRIAVLVASGLLLGIVLWPSVTTFSAPGRSGDDCVAIVDAWGPKSSQYPRDAACRPPSRTRVLVSGGGLVVLAVIGSAGAVVSRNRPRTRTNLRQYRARRAQI
jgi:hypothetical protein